MSAHILIIEDEASTLSMIEMMLKSRNYQVSCACNGQEGIDLLENSADKIDLVLLDMMMPVLDGLGFLKIWHDHPKLKSIPVVLQTGLSNQNEIKQAKNLGIACCLSKPFSRAELYATVKDIVGS
jgi:CheY-like chemotaxis protein